MILVVYLGHGIFHPVALWVLSKPVFGRGLNAFTTGNPLWGQNYVGLV